MIKYKVTIIGGGLAGSEAALVLANFAKDTGTDIKIKLVEMRPFQQTLVHKSANFAELVCSNSFKSMKKNSAAGMLKYELCALASPLLKCAFESQVDAGKALAVDRVEFSELVTKQVTNSKNIKIIRENFTGIVAELEKCDALILATGPLTSGILTEELAKITGEENLAFFDAAAPIVTADSIDRRLIFEQDRYDSEETGDYLNASLNKEEYERFINALLKARCVVKKDFEKKDLFQACQPIEEIARSGFDAPRYGPMKPVGLTDPRTGKRPYAAVQLRAENKEKTAYNLVGFQTNLCFPDQNYVFGLIPGLFNANIVRYGVMHRNTFLNAPSLLDKSLAFKHNTKFKNVYVAGQLGGTEGYLEAVRSGHHAALSVASKLMGVPVLGLSNTTVFGSLLDYACNPETVNYQPMHVNFGIIVPLKNKEKNKQKRYEKYAQRGNAAIDEYASNLAQAGLFTENRAKLAQQLKHELEKQWA